MAFPIPTFLQFAPPEAVLGDLAQQQERTLAREQGTQINLMELGLKRQQLQAQERAQAGDEVARANELNFKTFALMNNMTSDQAKLALERQKLEQEAQIAATQFQGNQNLQRDLAAGLPFEQAFQRSAPLLLFGNPAALGNFANTINRTKSQEEIAAEREANKFELKKFGEEEINKRFDQELNRKKEQDERNYQIQLSKLAGMAKVLPKAQSIKLQNKMDAVEKDFGLSLDQKLRKMDQIASEFEGGAPSPVQKSGTRVEVLNPKGKRVTIPEYQLEEAINNRGYKRI